VANPVSDQFVDEDAADTVLDLSNVFSDPDIPTGDSLTLTVTNGNSDLLSATLNGSDLSLDYMDNQHGTATITVRATDTQGEFVEDQFLVTVTSVNDAPVAADESYPTDGTSDVVVNVAEGVLANDTDVDQDALSASLVSGPSDGSVSLNPDGSFTYTPGAGFGTSDSFAYEVSDGQGGSDQAVVTLVLNTPPVADAGGPYSVPEGASVALDGSASSDAEQSAASLVYEWDLDGDGLFGETGADAARGDESRG
jgi:hypothetical protein